MSGSRWRVRAEIWVWRHGWAWPLTAFLLAAAGGAHLLLQLPAEAALHRAQRESIEAAARPQPRRAAPPTLGQLQAGLTPVTAPELARRMAELAQKHGVVASQAEYLVLPHPALELTQLQVAQPVRADYSQLRRYLEAVLRETPAVSLDHVIVRRDNAGQGQLEIRLRWSVWQPTAKARTGTEGP